MASIQSKVKKGRTYYYAVECKRVNGKPRIVWQKYLGAVESIVQRLDQVTPPKPKETILFEFGGVAAMLGITQRLGLIELIDQYVPKRNQGPTVGQYLVLAAINRVMEPKSKAAIGEWYEKTILRRLWGFSTEAFSSPRFWDHMDMVSEKNIQSIEKELFFRLRNEFGLEIDALLYDTTNFFTFIDTFNERNTLAQRGHNKQKRHDLRQVGLALLVSRAFQIPLFHRVFTGNIVDVSQFYNVTAELVSTYQEITKTTEKITFVMDKGNVSADNLDFLDDAHLDIVAAVGINSVADLLEVPHREFKRLGTLPGVLTYRTKRELWGNERTFVVEFSESFFTQQLASLTRQMVQCERKLHTLFKDLQSWREGKKKGKRPTVNEVKKHLAKILKPQHMKTVFKTEVTEQKGFPLLYFETDRGAFQDLTEKRLGKTVLATTRDDWSDTEIVAAYRGLSNVEKCFEFLKDATFLHWQPTFHWTDQKIMVHGFYCVLALTMASLARKILSDVGLDISLNTMLEDLEAIKETAVVYPPGTMAHRRDHIALTRMSPVQKKMAEILNIAQFHQV